MISGEQRNDQIQFVGRCGDRRSQGFFWRAWNCVSDFGVWILGFGLGGGFQSSVDLCTCFRTEDAAGRKAEAGVEPGGPRGVFRKSVYLRTRLEASLETGGPRGSERGVPVRRARRVVINGKISMNWEPILSRSRGRQCAVIHLYHGFGIWGVSVRERCRLF